MKQIKQLQTLNTVLRILFIALLCSLGAGMWFWWQNDKQSVPAPEPGQKNAVASSSAQILPSILHEPIGIGVNTLWFGDVFWGRYIDDWSKASPLHTAYPFSGLSTFEREKYDAWIADLECPLSPKYIDSATQDATLSFSCPPEYTAEAAKWFSAFTLANNHTDNREDVGGFAFTEKTLDEQGIQHFGSFDNARKNDICEVVTLPAHAIFAPGTPEPKNTTPVSMPFALCGFHNVFKLPLADEIAVISQYAQYFPTIVMPHQGAEYTYEADQLQESYAHAYIDAGADAVVGDHVHSIQNSEVYKGKLIVYSLGNFIFDQQSTTQVTQAIGLNMDVSFANDAMLTPYLNLAPHCILHHDDCLTQAQKNHFLKPHFAPKYDIVASDNSGKLAKKGSDELLAQLKKRLRWDKTNSELVSSMGTLFLTSLGVQSKKFRTKMQTEARLSGAKVVLVPNAAPRHQSDPTVQADIRRLIELGAQVTVQDMTIQSPDFSDASLVYVSGGNTFLLLDVLKKTHFLDEIKAFLTRGGTYIGVSAGSLIMNPDISVARDLQTDQNTVALRDLSGFGLVSQYVQVHYTWFEEPLVQMFERKNNIQVIRLDNESWIEVEV